MAVERAAVQAASFRGEGGAEEFHLVIRPVLAGPVEEQLDWVLRAYEETLEELGLARGTAVLRRFFLSDITNQAAALRARRESNPSDPDEPCAISWIGQAPEPPAKVVLWAYHVRDSRPLDKSLENSTLTLRRGAMAHRWSVGLTNGAPNTAGQTRGILQEYDGMLAGWNSTLAGHVIRTWFFVRDIDLNYHDFVTERREFFAAHGLTPQTHFIASSGIEGRTADPKTQIALDAWAISGVRPEQIQYLAALDHLSPTHCYGVTFERGTAVAWRDRRHVVLSGTASIDREGNILHEGCLEKQCGRTLENIEALLKAAGAAMGDLKMLIVYVRDISDFESAAALVRERAGDVPFALVQASVCRPGWLIEIEGIAIAKANNEALPEF
ncbi:translation initiation inhibitor [bacterium]|nr:translation initiation inhibitor [bacterium]